MPSPAEFQMAINAEAFASEQRGIVAGEFAVEKYWEKPFDNQDASTWIYRLGQTILTAYASGTEAALDQMEHPPRDVARAMPTLDFSYGITELFLRENIQNGDSIMAFGREVHEFRLGDSSKPRFHPHFGEMILRDEVRLTFFRSLPLPKPLGNVVGMFSKELVERPDTKKLFPIRYSFLWQNNPVSRPEILSGVTFNRRIDKTWPQSLTQYLDPMFIDTWDKPL